MNPLHDIFSHKDKYSRIPQEWSWLRDAFTPEEFNVLSPATDQNSKFIGIGFSAHGQFTQYASLIQFEAIVLEDMYRQELKAEQNANDHDSISGAEFIEHIRRIYEDLEVHVPHHDTGSRPHVAVPKTQKEATPNRSNVGASFNASDDAFQESLRKFRERKASHK